MKIFNVGREFSTDPFGRFRSDSPSSPERTGEAFREDFLLPKLKELDADEKLKIILDDGVESYGSSFLSEGFAGIVKYGYMESDDLLSKIVLVCDDEDFIFFRDKIISYIKSAKYASQAYVKSI